MTGVVDGGGTMVGWINTIPVITKMQMNGNVY